MVYDLFAGAIASHSLWHSSACVLAEGRMAARKAPLPQKRKLLDDMVLTGSAVAAGFAMVSGTSASAQELLALIFRKSEIIFNFQSAGRVIHG